MSSATQLNVEAAAEKMATALLAWVSELMDAKEGTAELAVLRRLSDILGDYEDAAHPIGEAKIHQPDAVTELRRFQRHYLLRTFGDDGHVLPDCVRISEALDVVLSRSNVLARPAPSPSDVDDLSTLSREHLIWRVTNWRRCFEQQQERAHKAEAELARMRGAAVPEGFAVVPKIPTDAMMVAALNVRSKNGSFKEMMAAMIEAAAPEVPR